MVANVRLGVLLPGISASKLVNDVAQDVDVSSVRTSNLQVRKITILVLLSNNGYKILCRQYPRGGQYPKWRKRRKRRVKMEGTVRIVKRERMNEN